MGHEGAGCCWCCRHVRFQVGLYTVGCLAGIAALIVFSTVMVVIPAAIWGGLAMCFSGYLVFDLLRNHNHKDKAWVMPLSESKTRFTIKLVLAVFGSCLSGMFCIYYLIRYGMIYTSRDSEPFFLSAIQAWMCFKWSLALTSHLYRTHHFEPLGEQLPVQEA